jgi:uncharacterized membrane protein YozB (DUF420 family)
MDPKLIFWTLALADLAALTIFALMGVRLARRGEVARHRRAMRIATLLVIGFLGAYLVKLRLLGREDMAAWSELDVWVLRIHELFVLLMLVAGAIAWSQARRLAKTQIVTHEPDDPAPQHSTLRLHRFAGRTAFVGAILAFATATGVLIGMYARAFGG